MNTNLSPDIYSSFPLPPAFLSLSIQYLSAALCFHHLYAQIVIPLVDVCTEEIRIVRLYGYLIASGLKLSGYINLSNPFLPHKYTLNLNWT